MFEQVEDLRIKITFTDFDLEDSGCQYDYVTIEDADGTVLLDKTCGTNMPKEPIFSNSNKAYLKFHSDGADQFKGFKAEWEEVKTSVNEITSPNYPQNYPSNPTGAPMKMPMEVSDGNRIKITFTDFELEDSGCRYDYVTIEDADGTMLLDRTCGSNMPREPIFSNTNRASLSFHSDGYDQFKGFRVEWEEAPECKNKIKGNM